ncbi:hypothetical protein BGZ47_006479 [Haplosporangium gracile]|nr:hypothetical protein BGZ47_006479 [Haplosporangium gracile]
MKRNSTQHSTSGTPPISFAAAAQKNTNKANHPPTQSATTTTPATPAATPSSVAAAAPAAASQTPSSTATTPSSGSQAAAVNNSSSTSSIPSKPTSAKPATSTPTTPSTANGNYSAVAAKANHAANRRSQAPTAAAAVKGQPAAAKPAATPAASVQFGSINDSTSGSAPAASSEETSAATATEDAMTFGSITATKKISSTKPEETAAAPAQEPTQPVPAESHHNTFKPASAHGSQNQHRRTDSTNSAHTNEHHYRAQVPPTVSQAPMMSSMGAPPAGAAGFNSQQPSIKNMRPMNPQAGHHMHPQHTQPQWGHNQYYMPTYDQSAYYQQPMYPQGMPPYSVPPRQPIATRQSFNTNAPAFTPQAQGSKRIAIINPETKAEVKPEATSSPSLDSKAAKTNVADVKAATEEEKKSIITPPPIKNVIKIVNPAEKEREERERKEKEEKERKEKEEKERKEKEEKERIEREAKETEERRIREEKEAEERRIREEQEEKERKEKEERERKEKEVREEQERIETERKRKEEEERIAREEAEAAEKTRVEKEKAEAEAVKEKERAEKLEAERRIALETAKLAEKLKQEQEQAVASEKKTAAEAAEAKAAPDSAKSGLSVDLARTVSAPTPSPSTRIENFGAVSYPSHIQSPGNADAQGKFRYDRDFLMQFMNVCTDKPDSLPSLDVLGGDGNERGMPSPGGSQRGPRGAMPNGRGKPAQPMGSFSFGNKMGGLGGPNGIPMGMRTHSGDTRIHRSPSDNNFLPRNNNLSRPPSQRGSRGGKRGGGGGRGGDRGHQEPALTIPLADIIPLEKTENAWTPTANVTQTPAALSGEEPISQEVVARKVKGLLNKLTLEKFDSISDKVIEIANLSSKEDDGTTLKHCIQIIFEKATDEPNFGSVYAQLCHKLMEKVSPEVKDVSVEGSTGGKLFRKYLLHRCQEDFMKGWKDKAAAGGVSLNDKDGPDLMSDEYYILMKAKRQGLGLIHFIGELFKLNMLTEKIMHECVKKLLANVKEPEEEETEGLCKLMTTVGLQLDRPEAKNHMDIYFVRMTELTKNLKLPSRIRFMVQDVIDLRANKWVNRRAAAGPKTIAEIHEEAARQAEEKEKEMMRRSASSGGARGLPNRREQLSRGPSFRGGSGDARHDMNAPQMGADGWSTVSNVPKKAGDLSSFGNTARSKVSGTPSLGPSQSVFGSLRKTKGGEAKAAPQPETPRQLSSTNIFAALEGDTSDRRGSVDAEKPTERRRLNLLPRTAPVEAAAEKPKTEAAPEAPKKTKDEAQRSIANTLKEYLSLKDMNEMLISVKELDDAYRPLLVTEFVNQSMEMKATDVDSIAEVFKKLVAEKIVSAEDFETGFADPLEFLPDTAIDVPNAYKYTAQLLEAAGMDPAKAAKP